MLNSASKSRRRRRIFFHHLNRHIPFFLLDIIFCHRHVLGAYRANRDANDTRGSAGNDITGWVVGDQRENHVEEDANGQTQLEQTQVAILDHHDLQTKEWI